MFSRTKIAALLTATAAAGLVVTAPAAIALRQDAPRTDVGAAGSGTTVATFKTGDARPDAFYSVTEDIYNGTGKVGQVVLWFNEATFQFHAQFRYGSQGSEVQLQESGYDDFRTISDKFQPAWVPPGQTSVNTGDIPWNYRGNGYWFRAQGWAGQTKGRNYTDSLSLYYDVSTGVYTLRQYSF
ncbi:hypothetical protein [Streptomyces sp. NPDC001401]|uniref:hypothetical protein n=1 Tax=Streptomyces sp. NPDC001401 TaxID=3364570 RepID=UPI0036957711